MFAVFIELTVTLQYLMWSWDQNLRKIRRLARHDLMRY